MANPVLLKKNTRIGEADAESDETFLESCFVDGGELTELLDCTNPRSIVLGRTGSGKTALLRQIQRNATHSITINPEDLALNFITNSKVLQFFEAAGVQLDVFYTLLWRHVLTVELLKKKYRIETVQAQSEFLANVWNMFGDNRRKRMAFDYLRRWGDQFWQETQYRTKEFTEKLERELLDNATTAATIQSTGARALTSLTEAERVDVHDVGQRVVNSVQMKELGEVISVLAEDIFNDYRHPYYILIDRLDEDWVDDRIRFKLIKALFEAIKNFRPVRHVKIIVALRTDLHFRVLKSITSPGFQTEKYDSMTLPINWTRKRLIELLDKRVTFQFRRQYTGAEVNLRDLMPKGAISKRSAIDYMLDRTFLRPREAIIFLNECIAEAEGKTNITAQVIRTVEVTYSNSRLHSLEEEWQREYPALRAYLRLIERRPAMFSMDEISEGDLGAFCDQFLSDPAHAKDVVTPTLEKYYLGGTVGRVECLREIIRILYQVGVVGVKPDPKLGRQWAITGTPVLPPGQPVDHATLAIQHTFWAALSVPSSIVDSQIDGA